MAIALTAEQRALLRSNAVAVRALIDFHMDSGRYSFWDGDGEVAFEGQTYIPCGAFGEISSISLGQDLGAEGVVVKLNGTKMQEASPDPLDPAALFGTIEAENYQLRRVDIRFVFFHAETGEHILVMKRYAGFIDQIRQEEEIGDNGAITAWLIINLESIVRRYGTRLGRTRSHDDQQNIYPDDTFFKFTAPSIAQQGVLFWGRDSRTYNRNPWHASTWLSGDFLGIFG